MNETVKTVFCWIGLIGSLSFGVLAVYLGVTSSRYAQRANFQRAARRAARAPLTDIELGRVDFDAELAALLERGDQ